ncbi:hypothetical protein STEG23_007613 [Scotinomys teguina]
MRQKSLFSIHVKSIDSPGMKSSLCQPPGLVHSFNEHRVHNNFSLSGEIIGGTTAPNHSLPYMALIKYYKEKRTPYQCGGFRVKNDIITTAASCKGREITVTLGAHDVSKKEPTQQKIKVKNQIVHPNYNFYSNLNDIMLLKLQRKAKQTPAVDTIPLPSPSDFIKPGRICRAAGWGRTGVMDPTSEKLREVKLRIMEKEACKNYPNYSYELQVCVGSPRKVNSAYKIQSYQMRLLQLQILRCPARDDVSELSVLANENTGLPVTLQL